MRKSVLAVVLVLIALPAWSAVQYEFFQRSSSDVDQMPPSDMNARALIEGDRTRIDVIGGNVYPPGTYVISTDGARRLFFVDPMMRTYTEFNTTGVATAIHSNNITIENLNSEVTPFDDVETIAGLPAKHYRLSINYDITVVFRGMPLKQNVRTVIDKWMTEKYGDIADTMVSANTYRTGNAEVDRLIDIETRKIRGFPLRQSATITTTNLRAKGTPSQLKLPTTRVISREMRVTAIRETKPDPAAFVVPAAYQRAENSAPQKPKVEVIQFDPPSK